MGSKSKSQFLKKVLPWFLGVAIIVYLIWSVKINSLLDALSNADVMLYLPVLVIFIVVNFLCDAQNMYAILKYSDPISFRDAMLVRGASYLLMIVDYTLGLGSIVYYLKMYNNIPLARGMGYMLFLNYIACVALVVMAIFGCLIAAATGTLSPLLLNIAVCSTILLVGGIIAIALLKLLPEKSFIKKIKQSEVMKIGIQSPFSFYLVNTLYRCVSCFTFVFFFYLAVRAFHMNIPFAEIITSVSVVLLVISIPITAFGLGTSQAAMLVLFRDYGSPAQILAFSLTYSASLIILRGIIGAFYYGIITKRVSYKHKARVLQGEVS